MVVTEHLYVFLSPKEAPAMVKFPLKSLSTASIDLSGFALVSVQVMGQLYEASTTSPISHVSDAKDSGSSVLGEYVHTRVTVSPSMTDIRSAVVLVNGCAVIRPACSKSNYHDIYFETTILHSHF